jgi:hypothetical protein
LNTLIRISAEQQLGPGRRVLIECPAKDVFQVSVYILGGLAESTDGIRRFISTPFWDLLVGGDRKLLVSENLQDDSRKIAVFIQDESASC